MGCGCHCNDQTAPCVWEIARSIPEKRAGGNNEEEEEEGGVPHICMTPAPHNGRAYCKRRVKGLVPMAKNCCEYGWVGHHARAVTALPALNKTSSSSPSSPTPGCSPSCRASAPVGGESNGRQEKGAREEAGGGTTQRAEEEDKNGLGSDA